MNASACMSHLRTASSLLESAGFQRRCWHSARPRDKAEKCAATNAACPSAGQMQKRARSTDQSAPPVPRSLRHRDADCQRRYRPAWCVIGLIKFRRFPLPPWPRPRLGHPVRPVRPEKQFAKLPAAPLRYRDGEQMLQKIGVSLFSPARIAIPPQLGQSLHPPRRAASDNRAVNRRRPADKPAHALRQPQSFDSRGIRVTSASWAADAGFAAIRLEARAASRRALRLI